MSSSDIFTWTFRVLSFLDYNFLSYTTTIWTNTIHATIIKCRLIAYLLQALCSVHVIFHVVLVFCCASKIDCSIYTFWVYSKHSLPLFERHNSYIESSFRMYNLYIVVWRRWLLKRIIVMIITGSPRNCKQIGVLFCEIQIQHQMGRSYLDGGFDLQSGLHKTIIESWFYSKSLIFLKDSNQASLYVFCYIWRLFLFVYSYFYYLFNAIFFLLIINIVAYTQIDTTSFSTSIN